jgi:NAD-dependent dihydropyrimidine dehydrogenase PreA subunit
MAKVKAPDTTLRYDEQKCNGCRTCTEVCPHAVFAMNGGKARLESIADCMECGACALNCKQGAISVDSGVGCASAMILTALTRRKEPSCGPTCC